MSHLSLEDLARLVDEAPDPDEAAHLAACADCRLELEALQEQTRWLRELPPPVPRADGWGALEARLRSEGLIRDARPVRRPVSYALLRMAAALAIFLAGMATGAAIRDNETVATQQPREADWPVVPAVPVRSDPTPVPDSAPVPEPEPAPPPARTPAPTPAPPAVPVPTRPAPPVLAGETDLDRTPRAAAERRAEPPGLWTPARPPATPDEAVAAVRRAEAEYRAAIRRYAELVAAREQVFNPVERLAALESIVLTTREALQRAPADPVINGYHLAALAQRDALLRRLGPSSDETTDEPWF